MIREATVLLIVLISGSRAAAQSSSLFTHDAPAFERPALNLHEASVTFHRLPPPRQIKVHDLITVRIDQKSVFLAEGEYQRRKAMSYNAVLKDWIGLKGLSVRPNEQSDGDPKISGEHNQNNRSQGELETRESLTSEIMAEVVDIRPNGTLVLEAHSYIENNSEVWKCSLSGVCRAEDVQPNNVVLSRNLAELHVSKQECGQVRDSYKRGWLSKFLDKHGPF